MKRIRAESLAKTYGGRKVVDDVSIYVNQGEVVGLLGPNGAGKTTSFYMIVGMIRADSGKIFIGDSDVSRMPMYRRARDGKMGYLAQESSVFRKLSVENNLLGVMELLGMDRQTRRKRGDSLLDQFDIARRCF